MITSKNLLKHELVGLSVEVIDSKNSDNKGIKGIIVNETRNTLVIESNEIEKIVFKEQCTFVFELLNGEKVKVEGKLLVARPEDRLKKKQRAW